MCFFIWAKALRGWVVFGMAIGSRAAPDTSCVTPGKIQCWCGPSMFFFFPSFISVYSRSGRGWRLPWRFMQPLDQPSITHMLSALQPWGRFIRGGGVVVGGALAGGDYAPAAAYREQWRCIISSATCGRRLLEQDHSAAPGRNVVNLMVGRQGRLGLHCWAKNTQRSLFCHKYD